MKKNAILLFLLVLLAGIAYYFFYKKNDGLPNESVIQIKDTANVGRIFMTDMQGRKIDLEKTSKGWVLNKSITPRADAIENLLITLQYQQAMQPVPFAQHNEAVKDLSANATKVEVYDTKGNKALSFFVGGEGENNTTYMMKEEAKRPYLYKLPGLNGFINTRYFLKMDEWRTHTVISLKYNEIKRVEIKYNFFANYSFWIEQNKGNITSSIPNINNTKASDYFRFFENVNCLGFENSVTSFDTLKNQLDKMCDLQITDVNNNNTTTLQLFYTPPNKRTKGVTTINGKQYDLDLLYGYDGKNIMTFITDNMRKILLLSSDFK